MNLAQTILVDSLLIIFAFPTHLYENHTNRPQEAYCTNILGVWSGPPLGVRIESGEGGLHGDVMRPTVDLKVKHIGGLISAWLWLGCMRQDITRN